MRRVSYSLLIGIILLCIQCKGQREKRNISEKEGANRLINSSSPYLLQHAYNPVDWYPWSDEAFERAKSENKLVLISIGYAACHWCHVMEHESFEDSAVAALMNAQYVSIKVDREERPDVDDIYMTACQLISKDACGWPLNVITLPDQRPIFAGTYFPKDQWTTILQRVQQIYTDSPQKAEDLATRITHKIQSLQAVTPAKGNAAFSLDELEQLGSSLASTMDMKKGGRKGSPKFPMPGNLTFLLHHDHFFPQTKSGEATDITLNAIAHGGIYDHLGGGFARYATDEDWQVPHFEKMLYDNGQLVSVYADAYKKTGNLRYKSVIEETLEFVHNELTSPEGGFYSSLDADSEGEEGKYYVWDKQEIDQVLGEDSNWFCELYQVTEDGNWEDTNIFYLTKSVSQFAADKGIAEKDMYEKLEEAKTKLLSRRSQRVRPGLDDKQITAWNALMLKGYVDAYSSLQDTSYRDRALKNARHLLDHCMEPSGKLYRIYKDGEVSVDGFLDDYAALAQALIGLYEITFDEIWLQQAAVLVNYVLEHFSDEQTQMFFYTSDQDNPLLTRIRKTDDNVIPSSNSTMAHVLYILGTYLYETSWKDRAENMLARMKGELVNSPGFYANWARLALKIANPMLEVAIVGLESVQYRDQLARHYFPNVLYLGGEEEGELELLENKYIEGQTTIYVCQNKTCKLPVTTVEEAMTLIQRETSQ